MENEINATKPFLNEEGLMEFFITKEEVQRMYEKVNVKGDRRPHVDTRSWKLVDRIIEIWFEEQGYDFWDNPYPEVEQTELPPEGGILIKYQAGHDKG